jgi:hypothetical protein
METDDVRYLSHSHRIKPGRGIDDDGKSRITPEFVPSDNVHRLTEGGNWHYGTDVARHAGGNLHDGGWPNEPIFRRDIDEKRNQASRDRSEGRRHESPCRHKAK